MGVRLDSGALRETHQCQITERDKEETQGRVRVLLRSTKRGRAAAGGLRCSLVKRVRL